MISQTGDGDMPDQPAGGDDAAPPPGPDSPVSAGPAGIDATDPEAGAAEAATTDASQGVPPPEANNPLEEAQARAARERTTEQGYQ